MNCIEHIERIARRLLNIIEQYPGSTLIDTPDYGWENHRYSSRIFRLAHVEIFNQNKFCVVHCCVFPHVTDPAPIFGFDVIAGENKVTGVFMDLSPTVRETKPFLKITPSHPRTAPDWGSIFSPHWLACRPENNELELIENEAVRLLEHYLSTLGDCGAEQEIIQAQNRYCIEQRKNEHTQKALIKLLGTEKSKEFMENILFPTIEI